MVSLMAVIGAYLGADGLEASGFMAVFVFGIMIGNKDAFGFAMEEGEQDKLNDFVLTTALIMRMFIFVLLGTQVDFALMNKYLVGGVAVVAVFMLVARPVTVFICALPDRRAKWTFKELLFMCWTRETGVIPGSAGGLAHGHGRAGSEADRLRHLSRHPDDYPDPGDDDTLVGWKTRLVGGRVGRRDQYPARCPPAVARRIFTSGLRLTVQATSTR